jgi:hypothetical protein
MFDAIVSVLLVLMPFLEFGVAKAQTPKPIEQPPAVERAVPTPPVPAPKAEVAPVTAADAAPHED